MIHRIVCTQRTDDSSHVRAALPDAAIDTNDSAFFLIDDGVDRDGSLARLSVAQNQLPLATSDGNQSVDNFPARL